MLSRYRRWYAGWTAAILLGLAGCGGGGADPAGASATMDAAGGQVATAEGVSVTVPAGALASATTIRIAKDATGAPALPTNGLRAVGDIVALTPHGSTFSSDVTLRVPAPAVTLANNEQLRLAKAQPGGEWEILDTTQENGQLVAQVRSFSFVVVVVVSYPLPMYQLAPIQLDIANVTCNGAPCASMDGFGPVNLHFTITNNGGQLPAACGSAPVSYEGAIIPTLAKVPLQSTRTTGNSALTTEVQALLPAATDGAWIRVAGKCGGFFFNSIVKDLNWGTSIASDNLRIGITHWPKTAIGISGVPLSLNALVATNNPSVSGQDADARIEWQSSNDGGKTWRIEAYSFAADWPSLPNTAPWRVSTVSHAITPNLSDNGSQWRLRVCWEGLSVSLFPESCALTDWLTLTVQAIGTAPAFSQQPRDTMILRGQTASFTAVADASPAISGWQWQSRAANSNGAWTDIAGATSATYTTPLLDLPDNGTQYRVLATSAAGSTASDTVTAAVSDTAVAPSFTAQPVSLSVITGSEAVFAIAARGTEGLSYQWRKNGTDIPGANASTLKLPATALADAGAYSVAVANAVGSITSQDATLTVSNATAVVVGPSIVTAPAAVQVHVGDSASLGVGAGGSGPLAYQWFKDGAAIPGATQAVYSLPTVALADAGSYSVRVSNSAGGVTSTAATLTVQALPAGGATAVPPGIDTQPASLTVTPGLGATLAVGASGSGPLSYQWAFNGTNIPGATEAALTLPAVSVSDAGVYRVTVSNSAGSVLSSTAQIIVVGAPAITADLANISVVEGSNASFSVTATGDALHYVWLYNGEPYAGTTDSPTLSVPVTLADNGSQWRVLAFNGAGIAFSRTATLTVTPAPVTASCTGTGNTGWCSNPVAANPSHVAFGSPNVGLAVEMYYDAQVLRTTDGGVTWTPQEALHTTRNFYAYGLAFADANTAILSGVDANSGASTILRSVDAGLTWTEVYTSAFGTLSGYLGKPVFLNANVGLVPANAQLLRTTDGGATWSVVQLGTGQWLNELAALPGGAVLGQGGDPTYVPGASTQVRLLHSTDGGQTWGVWGPPTSGTLLQYLAGMSFVDDLTGMALINAASGGTPARLARTTDGGRSWAISDIAGTSGMFSGVTMAADGTGVAMNGNVLMRTADAGATWLAVNPGTAQGLAAAATPSPGVFVVVGNQVILRNTQGGTGP